MTLVFRQQPARFAVEQPQRVILAANQQALLILRLRQIGNWLAHLVAGELAHAYIIVTYTAIQRGGKNFMVISQHSCYAVLCVLHHLDGIKAAGAYVPAHDGIIASARYSNGGVLVEADAAYAACMAAESTYRSACKAFVIFIFIHSLSALSFSPVATSQ